MTKEELFRAVGEVREDQITDAERVKRQNRPWRRYEMLAACLALVLAGGFALEYLEDTRRWAELEGNFQTADCPESAPDSGGGLDGAEYWDSAGKRPASNYSIGVEIAELQGRDGENTASNRAEGDLSLIHI